MIRIGLIGLGKMGLSHCSILNSHPDLDLVAVCDSTQYLLDVLGKYTGLKTYSDHKKMLAEAQLDAVVVATPSRFHGAMVREALDRGLHVFCEKPFSLDPAEGLELAELADARGLVNQVGYHYRFVETFQEAKRVIDSGALGTVHHVRAEAYGPVVLRPSGSTWRSSKGTGGGCLYDYACHALDLAEYLVGAPTHVDGVVLNQVFSRNVDDEVYATLHFEGGLTGQLAANWSDESHRKMSTTFTVWGSNGKMVTDRQECKIFLREEHTGAEPLPAGWTIRYTTDLVQPVWFYLRGEEYSAQIDAFAQSIKSGAPSRSPFSSAVKTDRIVEQMLAGPGETATAGQAPRRAAAPRRGRRFLRRRSA